MDSALVCHECSDKGLMGDTSQPHNYPPSHRQHKQTPRRTEDLLPENSPWRKSKPWTRDVRCIVWCNWSLLSSAVQTYEEIRDSIVSYKLLKKSGISHINILLIGEVGAGKSSFFNSVNSVFRGYVTSLANAGSMGKSVTTQVTI